MRGVTLKAVGVCVWMASVMIGCQGAQPSSTTASPKEQAATLPRGDGAFHGFSLPGLDGKTVDFAAFEGKYVLLVNTASRCGFTPQYEALQALHEAHGDKVVVLGFPANNFGQQEPGSNAQIASFCKKNYGVTFQMFQKISVVGPDQHPLYRWLSSKEGNGWNAQAPTWNFCKYLVDPQGRLVKFYPSKVDPMDASIVDVITGKPTQVAR